MNNEGLLIQEIFAEQPLMEVTFFLSYILVCSALFKSRFSRAVTVLALGAAGAVIIGLNAAVTASGVHNIYLMLTLFPLTAYFPFSVLLYFLSEDGIFENAVVCSIGTLEVLILKSLQKILISFNVYIEDKLVNKFYVSVYMVLAAAVLVFTTYRFIRRKFHVLVLDKRRDRLLLSIPIVLIFMMMMWFLNSVTDSAMLIFISLIAISTFVIIIKLLNSMTELKRVKKSEKELSEYIEIQRHGYDMAVRKMEATREHRHNMRHHLTVVEGLAKQGDCDKIIKYVSDLNGSLGKSESVIYCKNPEINAVLSEYISRAEKAGCSITQSLMLPEKLPFDEKDVCLVLANAVENAINACMELPEEKRYIRISTEYADGHRLLATVENPCSREVEFDENGLPVIEEDCSEDHGIGLRSVKRIVEKYSGFVRCMLENGEFVFQAALFYDNASSEHKEKVTKPARILKRVVSSLMCLCFGVIVMLNALPSAAEAVSELLSVNLLTIHNLKVNLGDNSVNMENPEFKNNGELNDAVKKYTDEAKETFLWYFNRRYNGYVAEDMKYTVIRDDEKYFIAQFNVTINAGGSMDYSRWIVFDKEKGRVLQLADMFDDDDDYIGILSAEILEQMKYKNEHEGGSFFVEGDDAFTEISEDANFYIDPFDRLVIVFDEYEVASGNMGSPQFYIPKKLFNKQ